MTTTPPPAYTTAMPPVGGGGAVAAHTPVVYEGHTTTRTYPDYKSKHARWLGMLLLGLGLLLIIFQIVAFVVHTGAQYSGAGVTFISAILTLITGSFCLASSKHQTQCVVVTTMVMAIISAVFVSGVVFANIGGIIWDSDTENCDDDDYYDWYDEDCGPFGDRIAIGAVLMCIGLTDLIIAIWGAVLGCKVCCCGKTTHTVQPMMHTTPQVIVANQTSVTQPGYYVQQPMQYGVAAAYPVQGQVNQQASGQALPQGDLYPTKE